MMGAVVEQNLARQQAAAAESSPTEGQIEQEKAKKQARIKHQHDLNSRLSVKKSALGKMLEAQKRKERILNPRKAEASDIDRETGSLFRGTAARNRSSRLDGDEGANAGQVT